MRHIPYTRPSDAGRVSTLVFVLRLLAFAALFFLLALPYADRSLAQSLSNLSPDQIQQLMKNASPEQLQELQRRGFSIPAAASPAPPQTPTVIAPAVPGDVGQEHSALETAFSDRAGRSLRQFGYEQVGVGASVTVPETGAVQDDYVIGPGDEIDVVLRGQENSEFQAVVDRNGQVVLPKTGPVNAAGKTLGQLRRDLVAAIGRAYVSTQAYISVGQLRQVTVMVAGEVANPGMRVLTGLSNPLDAILVSGGVKKSGSLRDIRLIRQGRTIRIDLYGILTKANGAHLINLQDGDRIFVPPIGHTVAIAGYVRRPAIYELPPGEPAIRAQELLSLGNGAVMRGTTTASILHIMPDGKGRFDDISGQMGALVRDGEVMIVKAAVDISVGRVTLTGAVRTPGVFALDKYKTLHQIIPSADALQPGAYVLFGFIDRIDQQTLQHEAIPFSPLHVINGSENVALATDDTVYVLTIEDVQSLLQASEEELPDNAGKGAETATANSPTRGTEVAGRSMSGTAATGTPSFSSVQAGSAGEGAAPAPVAAASAAVTTNAAATAATASDIGAMANAQFGNKLSDYRFSYGGAVQKPGTYLAAPNTSLAEAVKVLGGLSDDVDLSSFEFTSIVIDNATGLSHTERKDYPASKDRLASIMLQPYDQVEFRHVYSDRESGSVTIEGQVRRPGKYPILRAERLSSVLKRAGGLTEVAYPYGTVFLRQSVATQEAEQFRKAAADIRSQLFAVLMRPTSANAQAPTAETIVALQSLLSQIEDRQALGRISVVADPKVLAAHPGKDPILQPGDRIVVPKIPTSVTVMGEVMNPGAFPSEPDLSVDDYIDDAGGYTQFADTDRVVVVLPDGHAKVEGSSWLSFGSSSDLPPGTVIVVGRDVAGISFHQFIVDTAQIFSQLATSAAAIAVLSTTVK